MDFPTPSVGRQVWYYPAVTDSSYDPEPWAATVIKVHGPTYDHTAFSAVNLLAIDPDSGEQFFIAGVIHSPIPLVGRDIYRWMPYQLGQHRKAEEAFRERCRSVERGPMGLNAALMEQSVASSKG